jgi:hypothetical protein
MDFLKLQSGHKACDIFFNTRLQSVHTCWKGYLSEGEEFRTILDDIITALQINNTDTIIADARLLKIITFEDQKWIVDSWYPRALQAGFKMEALIISPESYSEQSIKKIVKNYDDTIVTTIYFSSYEEVEEWFSNENKITEV